MHHGFMTIGARPARWLAGLLIWCALLAAPALAQVTATLTNVEFLGPGEGFGVQPARFRLSAELSFSQPVTGRVIGFAVNGKIVFDAAKRSSDPLIDTMTLEKAHLGGEMVNEPSRSVYVQCYLDWQDEQAYTLEAAFTTADGRRVVTPPVKATAPDGGHIAAYPQYSVITVTERGGLQRFAWPVTVGVPIACPPVRDPATFLYLVRYDRGFKNDPVPLHLFEVVSPQAGPEIREELRAETFPEHAPTMRVFQIGFPVDLLPHGTGTYLLYYGTPTAPVPRAMPRAPLRYTGENPGVSIDTGDVVFNLSPKSGSLLTFVPKHSVLKRKYAFVQGEERDIHWNPDVWAPPLSWGHMSDWDLSKPGSYTPKLQLSQGPFAYRSFRDGIMWHSNETKTDVTYTFFAGMPFFYESSKMEFTLNTLVNAVRNCELVFNRGLFTHGVWADAQGNPREGVLLDPDNPNRVLDRIAELPPDTPYVGMFNEEDRVGIAIVTLSRYVGAHNLADGANNLWSMFYISDPGLWLGNKQHEDYAFSYISRPEIYYQTVVPRGTLFAERNAILVFPLGHGEFKFDALVRWAKLLRTPPSVTVAPFIIPPK